jgi:dTDP-4-amino-4,6-dideoxygalactose transaminase
VMPEHEGGPGLALIGPDESSAAERVILSRRLTRYAEDGSTSSTYRLERSAAARFGTAHCLATNSGSSAQLVALWALDLDPGSEVLVPAFGFASCFASIALAGCIPVLVDIDETLSISPPAVQEALSPSTTAMMVVHMLGRPADSQRLKRICDEAGVHLIEDGAQALGAESEGRLVGSIGRVGVFSLNPFKVITAGDGGLLFTSDHELYSRAFALHDHGARPLRAGVAGSGPLMGLNFRINEIGAAVAEVQLDRLDSLLTSTRAWARDLTTSLELPVGVRFAPQSVDSSDCGSAVVLTFDEEAVAARFADCIGTHTLAVSGKHNYAELRQLREWAFPRSVPRPSSDRLATYAPGAFPQTDSILKRTVALGVGVRDGYLGTGAGPHSVAEVRQFADTANKHLVAAVHN